MKKLVGFALFLILGLSLNVKAEPFCSSTEEKRLNDLANKVKIELKQKEYSNYKVFFINFSNMSEDLIIRDQFDKEYFYDSKEEENNITSSNAYTENDVVNLSFYGRTNCHLPS